MRENNKANVTFKPRARLLIHLGEKLIKSENIAVLELIKNSYDADAKNVYIDFNLINNKEIGEIIIEDDGMGMTDDVIENVWLEPGADFKDLLLKGNQTSLGFEYEMPKRKPIGEKGVGRFGVHKLGDYIELVTKSSLSDNEIVVKIDWKIFEEKKYIDEAKFNLIKRKPEVFKNGKTGTKLIIKNIRKCWDKITYNELYRSLNSLNSPFVTDDSFNVNIKLNLSDVNVEEEWSSNIISVEDIKEKALWYIDAEIEGNSITKFDYSFNPYKSMDKLFGRIITINSFKESLNGKIKLDNNIDLSNYKIGKIKFKGYVFDLSSKILKLGLENPEHLKKYLGKNGGVRVYRDGLRVYDYGEPGNDWLNLDRTRINSPTKTIGNKNILGYVELDRYDSQDLIEKTNREGFTENEAFIIFEISIRQLIEKITHERNIDKLLIREIYEGVKKNEPVNYEIEELKNLIDENFEKETIEGNEKEKLHKKIISSIDKVKKQYDEVNNILLKSAGAGLSLGVALHEIEKRIKELHSGLKNKSLNDLNIIYESINNVLRLIEGYTRIMTNSTKKELYLKDLINYSIFNAEYRFKAHKISIDANYLNSSNDYKISCIENITVGVMLNIFDNSIYWLDKYEIENKKIYITTKVYDDGSIGIIIADNGKGFGIDPELAIKPFITKKSGGMGLGLYIANEIMNSLNGSLNIRNYSELDEEVPTLYKNGAIVELIFPNDNVKGI